MSTRSVVILWNSAVHVKRVIFELELIPLQQQFVDKFGVFEDNESEEKLLLSSLRIPITSVTAPPELVSENSLSSSSVVSFGIPRTYSSFISSVSKISSRMISVAM